MCTYKIMLFVCVCVCMHGVCVCMYSCCVCVCVFVCMRACVYVCVLYLSTCIVHVGVLYVFIRMSACFGLIEHVIVCVIAHLLVDYKLHLLMLSTHI